MWLFRYRLRLAQLALADLFDDRSRDSPGSVFDLLAYRGQRQREGVDLVLD